MPLLQKDQNEPSFWGNQKFDAFLNELFLYDSARNNRLSSSSENDKQFLIPLPGHGEKLCECVVSLCREATGQNDSLAATAGAK